MTCCPFGRYHPAIVAQARATLAQIFPQRFTLALGSGQSLNDHITGRKWPTKPERQRLLRRSTEIIRDLWAGETVTAEGEIMVEEAKIYSRPETPPQLLGAAVSDESAKDAGRWADGLLTTYRDLEASKRIIRSFGSPGSASKPLWVKVGLSYAKSEELALLQAHREWKTAAFPNSILTELKTPAQFDEIGKRVRPEDMRSQLRVSADLDQHIAWLREDLAAGFSLLVLHNVGPNQREFIEDFGRVVLPALRR